MYSIHSKIQIQIQIPKPKNNNTQKSQTYLPPRRRTKRWHYLPTYLPTSYYKEKKKSINSGLTYLALALALPYTTVQGKEKKKPVVPDKRNFPLLRIERVYESLSLFSSSFSFFLALFIFFLGDTN